MHLIVCDDPVDASDRAARLIVAQRLSADPPLPIGLATGRTMEPLYRALVAQAATLPQQQRQQLRSGWLSFNLDEYCGLSAADPRSFAAFMARHLVGPLGLDRGQVQLPDGATVDPAAEAARYSLAIEAAGGIGLQLLGLGLNGHVGFNEPPCDAETRCRPVGLSPVTRHQNAGAFGGDPAAVPARAITLGLADILAAQQVLLVVTGSAKAAVLARLLEQPPDPALPASWLQRHRAVTVLADRAACAELA
ncbi:MAG: glucosamine-6-phosphate deaminase [Cyanobium sp.]|nr:glucosamine-6-phosphate deaminase [Cyanobium sp.]